jgi:hypothetical protein
MKTMLTASLLALASTVVGAGPVYAGTTHSSLFTPEQSNPGNPTLTSGVAVRDPQAPALTSLDQFEQGDPDAMVTAGYNYIGPARHQGPPGPAVTSLDQFEQGDPDAVVTAGYHYTAPAHHGPLGPVVTSLAQFEKGDPDTTPGG